jgi:hypothetical protein
MNNRENQTGTRGTKENKDAIPRRLGFPFPPPALPLVWLNSDGLLGLGGIADPDLSLAGGFPFLVLGFLCILFGMVG